MGQSVRNTSLPPTDFYLAVEVNDFVSQDKDFLR